MRKLLLGGILAAVAMVCLAMPAQAGAKEPILRPDGEKSITEGPRGYRRHRRHGGGGSFWIGGGGWGPRYYGGPRYYAPRYAPRYYYAPPPVYYAPPPVVYAPPYYGGTVVIR